MTSREAWCPGCAQSNKQVPGCWGKVAGRCARVALPCHPPVRQAHVQLEHAVLIHRSGWPMQLRCRRQRDARRWVRGERRCACAPVRLVRLVKYG